MPPLFLSAETAGDLTRHLDEKIIELASFRALTDLFVERDQRVIALTDFERITFINARKRYRLAAIADIGRDVSREVTLEPKA